MKKIEELNNIQESFATILWYVILSDTVISQKEEKSFDIFFKKEFSLNQEEIDALCEKAQNNQEDIEEHLDLLKIALSSYPQQKARFMNYLNRCIICDGVDDREYKTFEEIREKLF